MRKVFHLAQAMEQQMSSENLEQRVKRVRNDSAGIDNLIQEYLPFIRKVAVKTIPSSEYDSYSTTAMAGFAEAVGKFDSVRSGFLSFASIVISNRIKDQIRKEYKPMEVTKDIIELTDTANDAEDRRLEVDEYKSELLTYGISLAELVKRSPKHRNTRNKANRVSVILAKTPELLTELLKRKKLPVKRLSSISGISTKLIEQKRHYIIARTLLKSEKYLYLKEYAETGERK